MGFKKLNLVLVLTIISIIICEKSNPITDDPKLDYAFQEEGDDKGVNYFAKRSEGFTEKPVDKPIEQTNKPIDSTENLINLNVKPTDLPEKPIDSTVKPTDLPEKPIDSTVKPTDLSEKPIDSTDKPVSSTKPELEIEENIVTSELETNKPQTNVDIKPSESVTTPSTNFTSMCSLEANIFADKITQMTDKFVPEYLKLMPIKRGNMTKIILDNGKLTINKDYKLIGQPICTKIDEQNNKYDFSIAFNNIMGFYEWKIYNLFGYNLSESALITIKQIMTDIVIIENDKQRTKLEEVKVGKIEGLKVKVNIPERLASISFIKPMLEYVISRISTMIANGSMDSITKNIRNIFYESIQEKIRIKP